MVDQFNNIFGNVTGPNLKAKQPNSGMVTNFLFVGHIPTNESTDFTTAL
jgi:hypothetical protein